MKLARSNAVSNTSTMKSEKRLLVCSRDISFLYILKCLLQSSCVVVYICHVLQKCTTALKSPSDVEVSDFMRYAQTRNRTGISRRKRVFETRAVPLCHLGMSTK